MNIMRYQIFIEQVRHKAKCEWNFKITRIEGSVVFIILIFCDNQNNFHRKN